MKSTIDRAHEVEADSETGVSVMNREHFEAELWRITGSQLTANQIGAIINTCETYATTAHIRDTRAGTYRHTSDRDLYPVIGVLADALLNQHATKQDLA